MQPIGHDVDITLLIEQKKAGKHRRVDGRYVEYFSEKCRVDLQHRIDDAIHSRDFESHRTDARSYYNGVLNVLRRKMREVNKELAKRELELEGLTEGPTSIPERISFHRDGNTSQRVLRLSGLL